jgi:RNA polymerase-interacting CarD/CdnL/TRCF family regulator
VYIPRDTELYPALTQGLEARDDLLRQALGLTADPAHRLIALLWPDQDGALVNFHVPLDGNAGFVPLGSAAQTLNARVLTPEAVAAVSAQVFDGLREAIRPERVPEDVQALRDRIVETYQAAWNEASQELEQLLVGGNEVERLADAIRESFADVEALERQQLDDWCTFLQHVLALAEKIEARAAHYNAEVDAKHAALIEGLRQRVETNYIRRLRDQFEQVAQAVHVSGSPQDRADIAAQLEALAAELRGGRPAGALDTTK